VDVFAYHLGLVTEVGITGWWSRTLLVPALTLGTVCLLSSGAVSAQVSNPRDFVHNPHPTMPWTGITYPGRVNYGKVVGSFWVPPRKVVIEVYVSTPEGLPRQTRQQGVEIPGYYVVETTTGFYYPTRWMLEQLHTGLYRWRQLPPAFVRK